MRPGSKAFAMAAAVMLVVVLGCRKHVVSSGVNLDRGIKATKDGDLPGLQTSIKDGLSVNARDLSGNSLMAIALMNRQPKIAEYLLNHGADPDIQGTNGFTPLFLSIQTKEEDLALSMIKKSKNLNLRTKSQRFTAMHFAAQAGSARVVEALIKGGAELDPRTSIGVTPLIRAAINNTYSKVSKVLLDAGANPKLKDNRGRTAEDWLRFRSARGS